MPNEVPGLKKPHRTSKMLPMMTWVDMYGHRYSAASEFTPSEPFSAGAKRKRVRLRTDAAVKAVEGGVEVETRPKAVHLEEDLGEEESQEEELGIAWTQTHMNGTQSITPWDAWAPEARVATHRGSQTATWAGCGALWPRRACLERPGSAQSSRRCASSPRGGWRCARGAPCDGSTPSALVWCFWRWSWP